MTDAEIAIQGEILRSEVGSTLHGTGLDGQEDRDEMGVCLEPHETVLGLDKFEQYVYRTQPEGVRSGPGDLDLTIYSARKYLRLAAQGNPSILLLLFAPDDRLVIKTRLGEDLRKLKHSIVSMRAIPRFRGYLRAQRERLDGSKGGKHTNRPELVEQFGYDCKYAMHALRLGYQGLELATTGNIVVPIPKDPGDYLRDVRSGKCELKDVLEELDRLESNLDYYIEHTKYMPLPQEPDYSAINHFLYRAHINYWETGLK